MTTFIQHVVDALSLGSLYALYALGIAIIFGVARIVNFAQGEIIMVSTYILLAVSGAAWPLAIIVTIAGGVLLALAMERLAFRPVRGADPTTLLVVSFALSVLLQNLVIVLVGARSKSLDFGSVLSQPLNIGSVTVPKLEVVTIIVTIALVVGLSAFLKRTRIGVELRAAAEDFEMARLLGVRANRVIAIAFALSGSLAAIAAILLAISTGTTSYNLGLQLVLIAFLATVVGGLGSLWGAVAGGFLLGGLTVLLQVTLPDGMQPYRDALVFAAVILFLLARPTGIAGQKTEVRV